METRSIKTYNTAKKFADEILYPLLNSDKEATITFSLGAKTTQEAEEIPPEKRMIRRFNSLKERITVQQTLIVQIEAIIRLRNKKNEVILINRLSNRLDEMEEIYNSKPNLLIVEKMSGNKKSYLLTDLSKRMNKYLNKTSSKIQWLMTKNKLLFVDEGDEFLDNEKLMDRIKAENRNS